VHIFHGYHPLKTSKQNRQKFIRNARTASNPSPLSLRTHHNFEKSKFFETKATDVRIWKNPPLSQLQTSAMDSPLVFRMGRFYVIRCWVLLFEASPQCHRREPPNLLSLWGGIGDRKLVIDRSFAPLLRICSLPRAPSPTCALLSGTIQRQYVVGLVWLRKV